jgi:nicotinamide riboside transporter PnuC
VGGEISSGTEEEGKFKSDVIFIFLFQFLFTRKGFSLKHEKNVVVQIGRDFYSIYVWIVSMFNQFFTLLSRPGKAEWTTICLFKMLRWGFFQFSYLVLCVGGFE